MNLDKINLDLIKYNKPEKQGSKYFSKITYLDSLLEIKLDLDEIELEGDYVYIKDTVFFESLENHTKTQCFENSKEWFKGKTFTFQFIQEAFVTNIMDKIIKIKSARDLVIYDSSKKLIPFENKVLENLSIIISIPDIWISPHHIGINMLVKKINLNSYCFISDTESEDIPSEIEQSDNES